jgi:hypothetical protein
LAWDLVSGMSNPGLVFGMQKITTTSHEIMALNFWHAKNHHDITRNSGFKYRYGIHQLEMYIWPTKNHYDVM